jgi:hypothetical protein
MLLTFLLLAGLYALAIGGLIWLLRTLGVSRRSAILSGFLGFGVVAGALTAWAWPLDSSVYFNVPASLLGDQVYGWSIRVLGDPGSAQAHSTIPWLLRIPQVYVLVSIVLSGLAGWAVQWGYNRRAR